MNLDDISRSDKADLAENEETSSEIFEALSNDKDWHIRLALAENVKLPHYLLCRLRHDENKEVRETARRMYIARQKYENMKFWIKIVAVILVLNLIFQMIKNIKT